MFKLRSLATVAIAAGAVVFLSLAVTSAQDMPAPFGGADDLEFAGNLWAALESDNRVGANVEHSGLRRGRPPHGAVIETVETEISVNGRSAAAIIKYNFGPAGLSVEDAASNPGENLKAITVMFKRESGYDADNKDWFWAKYMANGTLDKNPMGMSLAGRVAKGMDQGCIACHGAAPGGDYVYADSYSE